VHLVLYDGVCGLCSRLVQFLLRHDRRGVFDFASLQSPIGRASVEHWAGNPDDLTSFYLVANYRSASSHVLTKSRAALFVAGELRWPWKAARAMRAMPTSLLDRVYDFIANHRYEVFGRRAQCFVPASECRDRFVD
jgi:predicted DCC family thiol-disulfide oxidoreductase YuxK